MTSAHFTSFIAIVALLIFSATSTSASPLAPRQLPSAKCSPNFEGAGVSVTNSAREWGVSAFNAGADVTSFSTRVGMLQNADFRFEQVGSPSPSYIIKEIDNNDLVVGLSNQFLKLAAINAADLTQKWNVVCDTCETGISQRKGLVATGCNITSITNNLCVQIGVQAKDAMFLAGCDNSDSQNFDFWTAIPW